MRLRLRLIILSVLLLVAEPARADIKPAPFDFPPDDSDLQQVIAAAAYQAAAVCDMECPKTDCAAAQAALQALSDMQAYLNELVTALGAANADALAHFQSLAKNSITKINFYLRIFSPPPIPHLDTLLQNGQLLFVCHGFSLVTDTLQSIRQNCIVVTASAVPAQ